MSRGEGDFLGRWSARKLKAREPAAEPAPPEAAPAAVPAPDLAEKTDEQILQELGLPDPETLGRGDDFSVFLKAAVPSRLRNRALRRLWLSDPVLANVDGLNDYDGDYTDAALVVKGGVKTAYKVGRGFLRDDPEGTVPEETVEVAEAAPEQGAETPEQAGGGTTQHEAEIASQEGSADEAPAGTPADPADLSPDHRLAVATELEAAGMQDDPPPRPPRMRFRFDGG